MFSFERQEDWSFSAYGCEELKEELPCNMPPPLGPLMTMSIFVDSDHAGDLVTCRSRTGFVVFLNSATIYWSSKKQTSCKTSTFGSEFVAMKQATEYARGLRYKLQMMGITVDEPTFIYGDQPVGSCQYDFASLYFEKEVKRHSLSLCSRRMCS